MEINKVVNHIPHKLKPRVVKKSLRKNFTPDALFKINHKTIEVRNYHLMIEEVKRFDKVAAAKLEKLMRVKNRDSLFCYGDNLCGIMKWVSTEEGYNYWAEVYEKLRQQRDQDFNKAMDEIELF
ncbi:hypothetical protein vBAbaPP1_08 [Acinetobacter phage vB_AbaM_P1]|nr:hypothetical protein vBAbaPP1_08 [Acinetobacter phage vB_AbaM_P1]WAX22667.1 hypothetical protein [Acinetobacter phage vB_AbaP_HB01]